MKIGSHVGMSGKKMMLGAIEEALSYNSTGFMIYTGAPQNTRRKKIEDLNIEAAHLKMKEVGMELDNVIVHAPYIINLANPDKEKNEFAINFLVEEIKRTSAMGIKQIVLHPGAHVGQGSIVGVENIVKNLKVVLLKSIDYDVKIALETMAGKGTEIGRNFDELSGIIKGCNNSDRLSVCFDTCHVHDSGYDLKNNFDEVLNQFDEIVGIDRISCIHINDSKNICGAKKDRHANIGFGEIGFEALNYIVHHKDLMNIPKFLETPYIPKNDEDKKKIFPPYKEEIEMFKKEKFNKELINNIREKNKTI